MIKELMILWSISAVAEELLRSAKHAWVQA